MGKERDFLDDMIEQDSQGVDEAANLSEADDTSGAVEQIETGEKTEAVTPPKAEAPPAKANEQEDRVPIAALMAERDNRKKERERAEALQRQLDEIQTRQSQQQPEPFYVDPENFVRRQIDQATSQLRQQHMAALEEDARAQNPDYDEVLDFLKSKAQENPALANQVFQSPNPARAAYKLGKQLREMDSLNQDPDTYRKTLEAEIRTKVEAEFREKEEARRKQVEDIPPDLASARSASVGSQALTANPVDTIFPRN